MSKLGCTELIFVQPEAKVNGAYYRDELLVKHMLPAIRQIAGDHFIFQQDSAPAHRAGDTVDFLRRSTGQRRSSSPRLVAAKQPRPQPGGLQDLGCDAGSSVQGSDPRPGRSEATSDYRVVRSACSRVAYAVDQCRKRLRYCVETSGRHFEHLL